MNCQNQLNFSFILGVLSVMQGVRRNWTLTMPKVVGWNVPISSHGCFLGEISLAIIYKTFRFD